MIGAEKCLVLLFCTDRVVRESFPEEVTLK